jgi:hypothetical protein
VAIYGGTAGEQYDPCYHLACDTFDNVSLEVLGLNADAVAAATLRYAMNTRSVTGVTSVSSLEASQASETPPQRENAGPLKLM